MKSVFTLPRLVLALGSLLSAARACGDDHGHVHGKRASSSMPITAPARPLVWSDFNVIHTTDSHGWLLGHQKASPPEPNYSGDFGDFASFVSHMKEIALEKNVDLLLVDSGDLHDGTGLSDGYPAGGVDAHDSNQFIKKLPYDVMAIGNHELYVYNNTLDMYTNFAPHWKGRYLSSNANITVPDPNNANATVSVPVGNRYAKFKSRLGRRITSLGVIFDFTGNDNGTTVQKVEDMVKEQWFSEAIEEEPDLFLLVGHMPVSKDNWPTVFNAIRAVHPTTPILIFGGHTHIRDCTQFDGRSMALESGRYMETVGWMSVDLNDKYSLNNNKSDNLTFTRRYLDTNRVTYEYHTGRNSNTSFDTSLGTSMSTGLQELAERFDLNLTYGVAPHDFLLTRAPYPGNDSLLSLFIEQATPVALQLNNSRAGVPALFITNSGSQRFDILSGTFTKNDQITASPFADAFLYLPNITFSVAKQVLPALNAEGADGKRRKRWIHDLYARGEVEVRYNAWLGDMNRREDMLARREAANATLGYVTTDSCPGAGDDTVHTPLPYYSTPDFVGSDDPDVSDDAEIDLVFVDFIENQLLGIVNDVQKEKTYTSADVQSYSPLLSNQLLGVYAEQKWN